MTPPAPSAERILIIEDEDLIRLALRSRLEREGYVIDEAPTAAKGLEAVRKRTPDLILLDKKLPDQDGMEVLRAIALERPRIVVILITAFSTVEGVVEAMRLGAYTYINKPFDMDELVIHVQKGLETTALRREVDRLRRSEREETNGPPLIAQSEPMKEILETVKKVNAVGSSTLLLRGENGTGKDVLARSLHANSSRRDRPFQNITCTAISDNLLESELFGHERGAFTDAKATKMGLIELADGGTVFLDEIGDLSLPLQGKLLRFLEDRTFRRVGGTEDIEVDVRIIAATNRDLEQAVETEAFRQDLFYRISVIPIPVPPLRSRKADIAPLAALFIDRFNREFRKQVKGLEADTLGTLEAHDWPGNVRELRNAIERAMILGTGDRVQTSDLPPEIVNQSSPTRHETATGSYTLPAEGIVFEEHEKDLVIQALKRTNGNQTRAARLLGMTRDQIRYRLEKFDLGHDQEVGGSQS